MTEHDFTLDMEMGFLENNKKDIVQKVFSCKNCGYEITKTRGSDHIFRYTESGFVKYCEEIRVKTVLES